MVIRLKLITVKILKTLIQLSTLISCVCYHLENTNYVITCWHFNPTPDKRRKTVKLLSVFAKIKRWMSLRHVWRQIRFLCFFWIKHSTLQSKHKTAALNWNGYVIENYFVKLKNQKNKTIQSERYKKREDSPTSVLQSEARSVLYYKLFGL